MSAEGALQAAGFAGPEDYVERITYLIWNRPLRRPQAVADYYSADAPIHLAGGDLVGADVVTANTLARLQAFPDFRGVIDDTIWTGSDDQGYRTSMRWTWTATHTGAGLWGAPTGRSVRFSAIANCIVDGHVITEEWLASEELHLTRQLGWSDDEALQRRLAAGPPQHVERRTPIGPQAGAVGGLVTEILESELVGGRSPQGYAAAAVVQVGATETLAGHGARQHWAAGWADLGASGLTIDDQYAGTREDTERVATQWTVDIDGFALTGISHHHVRDHLVTAAWHQYDTLALRAATGH